MLKEYYLTSLCTTPAISGIINLIRAKYKNELKKAQRAAKKKGGSVQIKGEYSWKHLSEGDPEGFKRGGMICGTIMERCV